MSHGGAREGSGRKPIPPAPPALSLAAKQEKGRLAKQEKSAESSAAHRHRQKMEDYIERWNPYAKNRPKTQSCNMALLVAFCQRYKQARQDTAESRELCLKAVATTMHCTESHLRMIVAAMWANPEGPVPFDAPRRRRPSVTPWVHGRKVMTAEVVDWLKRRIARELTDGISPTFTDLLQQVVARFQIDIKYWTLRRLLIELDYRCGNLHIVGRDNESHPTGKQQFREYAIRYSKALAEEREGKAVIVYQDESYVHTTHSRRQGVHFVEFEAGKRRKDGTPGRRRIKRRLNKVSREEGGVRLVIVHAITRDGWFRDPTLDRMKVEDIFAQKDIADCEMIFEASMEMADYHVNMNSKKFMHWATRRLLPTARLIHPGKKIVLILDNAKYHHKKKDTYLRSGLNKEELVALMETAGIISFSAADSKGVMQEYRASQYGAGKQPGGPTNDQLLARLKMWAIANPETQEDYLQELFREAGAADGVEHEILWTTPYESRQQPIEEAWGHGKNYVASMYTRKLNPHLLRERMQDGMYGNHGKPASVTKPHAAPNCSKLVRRTHEFIDAFIARDSLLDGCLENLDVTKYNEEKVIIEFSSSDEESSDDQGEEELMVLQGPGSDDDDSDEEEKHAEDNSTTKDISSSSSSSSSSSGTGRSSSNSSSSSGGTSRNSSGKSSTSSGISDTEDDCDEDGEPLLHCLCRQPTGGNMAECDGCGIWFHQRCLKMPKKQWEKIGGADLWYCPTCASDMKDQVRVAKKRSVEHKKQEKEIAKFQQAEHQKHKNAKPGRSKGRPPVAAEEKKEAPASPVLLPRIDGAPPLSPFPPAPSPTPPSSPSPEQLRKKKKKSTVASVSKPTPPLSQAPTIARPRRVAALRQFRH
jgi:uncharacterized membrane protein YgcG